LKTAQADGKSAVQQSETLRYGGQRLAL